MFNRNTIKVSYCCMSNMHAIISGHNSQVLAPKPDASEQTQKSCNCTQPMQCPLSGKCQTKTVIYKATVTAPTKPVRHYYGLTERSFKERYGGHKYDFAHVENRKSTALSKYIWELKDNGIDYNIRWSIDRHVSPYKCGTRRCDVCLSEKMVIATADQTSMLNSRSEIVSACRHRWKYRYTAVRDAPT